MKHMFNHTCDQCIKVIIGIPIITEKSKKDKILEFCSVECQQKYNKPKKCDLCILISDDQAAEFIHNSNAIEEIVYSPTDVLKAWQQKQSKIPEISGQVSALNYTLRNYKHKLTVDIVCKIHKLLMKEMLPPWYIGLRRDWVRVGDRLCPPPSAIKPMLQNWCDKVNKLQNPTEEEVWQSHLAFETIHPFIDGNGRSGRLLWLWIRYKHGFGYAFVSNDSKHNLYYPQFLSFNFENWLNT